MKMRSSLLLFFLISRRGTKNFKIVAQRKALLSTRPRATAPAISHTPGASPDMGVKMLDLHVNSFNGYWFIQTFFFFLGQYK